MTLGFSTLENRWWSSLCRFAVKIENDKRFEQFLQKNPASHGMTVRERNVYREPAAKSERFRRSPVVTIIRMLNEQKKKELK